MSVRMQPASDLNMTGFPGRSCTSATALLACLGLAVACAQKSGPGPAGGAQSGPRNLRGAITFPWLTEEERRAMPERRAVAERLSRSYVKLTLLAARSPNSLPGSGGGELHTGSGIILDRAGHILTAAHIARGVGRVLRVELRDGRRLVARVIAVAPQHELALLRVARLPSGLRPASLGTAPVAKGQPVLAMGSPNRTWGVATVGIVRDDNIGERLEYGAWGFDNAIEISMQVASGNSGGPVVNRKGEVIGMVASYELGDTSKWPYRSPRITYVVPVRDIRTWLRQQEKAAPKQ